MEVQKDFKELLELFNVHHVDYLIVGGYALALHGSPRYTGDIDLLIKPDQKNAERILKSLDAFGFGSIGLREEDLTTPEKVIQLGYPPVRIDIMTSLSGVSWEEAYNGRVSGRYGDIQIFYIGREQLILNKKTTSRKKDLADLEALGEE
ncbi:MAG: hypothetical protein C4518_05665 [Desulfobacteraceae bacterium]|nr:MAG: hypothetical protein C4518_05665 [Desulfobacteraceae bacterium]